MPKKKRIWYAGAVYHIMSRGNRRSDIFKDEEDYQKARKAPSFSYGDVRAIRR